MSKKIISCLLILYIVFLNNSTVIFAENETSSQTEAQAQQDAVTEPELIAESAVMIDADTGIVIYEKDCHSKRYPASITKIMTTLLALENTTPDEVITHSHNAVYGIGPGSSHIGMREGEQITMEQALNGIMLASANEVCMAVAEHIDGSVESFVDRMNAKAQELGAVDTHFNNPHGFHDDDHYTTAYDMALIMQEAIKNEDFVKLISTKTYTIPTTNIVDVERPLTNKNKMIHEWSPFYYEYCVGSKTGFTDEAGNTLVTYGKKDNINLITVVMKDQGTMVYDDTRALLEYGFSLYDTQKLLDMNDFSKELGVSQTYEDKTYDLGTVSAVLNEDINMMLPNTVDISQIEYIPTLPENITAPVKKGDVVGSLSLMYDSKEIKKAELVSSGDVEAIEEEELIKIKKKEELKNTLILMAKIAGLTAAAVVVAVALIICVLKLIRQNKRRARRARRTKNTLKLK